MAKTTVLTPMIAIAFMIGIPATAEEISVFFPDTMLERARFNVERFEWAAAVRQGIVDRAEPWRQMSDDELWELMFGATIPRSWMVWSNGHCPACTQDVPLYNWRIDALKHPWKLQCPHCKELFPKNDFARFYQSGLDEHHVFDAAKADRSLLYNTEHADADDPLRMFGVDDGDGYVDGERRWRFVGTYLVYGQWKQLVVGGLRKLGDAYVVTGDPLYARKAALLLDRVADLYPTFDFKTQGIMYEGPAAAGYVSTWHDACEEVREMALAYDQIRGGLGEAEELVTFLSARARQNGLENPKATVADIHRNIKDRILLDSINNAWKIRSNYPRQDVALIVLEAVRGWPQNREKVMGIIGPMIEQATAVDGVTGEKGISVYTCYAIAGLADFLALWDRAQPSFLDEIVKRHPRLRETYSFHIDTWCSAGGDPIRRYYPQNGDSGTFAVPEPRYLGVNLPYRIPGPNRYLLQGLAPWMYTFLLRMSAVTGDPAFAQAAYVTNGDTVDGLSRDLFAADPSDMERQVRDIVDQHGPEPLPGTLNKQQWRLAVLRSGEGPHARAAWLDYDAGDNHAHWDAMSLGLFAKGLDLMPDLGYPPVQYGGWSGPRFDWYRSTASHNTVVVDGSSQVVGEGMTTLWGEAGGARLIRADAPETTGCSRYERTVAMVDTGSSDSYLVDVFRVTGGTDHAKFMHSHYGVLTTPGLISRPAPDYGHGALMRGFKRLYETDGTTPAQPGWMADWDIEDRQQLTPSGADVHLRYTDLTTNAEAYTSESWVAVGGTTGVEEAWIHRLMVRRQSQTEPLVSTFVSVIEPYEGHPIIAAVRRLPVQSQDGKALGDSYVGIEVDLPDGRQDLFVAVDAEHAAAASGRAMQVPGWEVSTTAQAALFRRAPDGNVIEVAVWGE